MYGSVLLATHESCQAISPTNLLLKTTF